MAKGEISWRRETGQGRASGPASGAEPTARSEGPTARRVQVYARHVGHRWLFYAREGRYDQWQPVEQPPLEDWLELLDGVRRRIARRLLRPEEEARVKKTIRERFPEAEV